MIALALLVLVLGALREAEKRRVDPYNTIITAIVVGIVSGIVVSRLLHVIDKWGYYSQNPWEIIGGSGLTIYGAILGALLGIWIYSKFSGLHFGYCADWIAPYVILAQAIGRVGCTINGCCYGIPTSLPWSIVYTHPGSAAPLWVSLHPTQIYEIIYNLIVFGVLLKLRGRLRPDGSVLLLYLVLYAAWRFGIGFLREGTPILFGLHQAQVVSLIVLAVTIPLLALRTRWVKAEG